MSFFSELKRRNVVRVAFVYLASSWLLIQVGDVLFPVLQVPDWTMRLLVGLLTLGLPVALILAWAFNITAQGIQRENESPAQPSAPAGSRRMDFVIMGILAAAVAFMLVDNYLWDHGSADEVFLPGSVDAIAVLPLELLNNDDDQEYLADGMTISLITELSKIESLRIISRTSVQRYKGTDTPVSSIARDLGVDAIIEGTVMRVGDDVRINAHLVPATSDTSVWNASYDRDLGDVLALHSEIAQAIAAELRVELSSADEQRLIAPDAVDANVQNLILEGRYRLRDTEGREGMELLEAATISAPDYAPAWAAIARAYLAWGNEDPKNTELARQAANRAMSLDENLADAHYIAGALALYYDWDWQQALDSLDRALELNPGHENSWQTLGDYYEVVGDYDKSIELGRKSVEAAPNSENMWMNLGLSQAYGKKYREALESCDNGLPPREMRKWTAYCVATAHLGLNDKDKAIEYARTVVDVPNMANVEHIILGVASLVLGEAGDQESAAKVLADLELLAATHYVSPTPLAYSALGAGDTDAFFVYLERAVNEKAIWSPWVNTVPYFKGAREDPRYGPIRERMNLPE